MVSFARQQGFIWMECLLVLILLTALTLMLGLFYHHYESALLVFFKKV